MKNMMTISARLFAMALLSTGVTLGAAEAEQTKIIYAMPSRGISYSYVYVAQSMGYWKNQGLDVELTVIPGVAGTQAMLAGDVQFAASSGIQGLNLAAAGQTGYAVANIHNVINFELLLSTEAAKRTGLDPQSSTQEARAKALKGLVVGVEGAANSIPDALGKYILKRVGGLNPDVDVTIAYIPTGSGGAAVKAKRVDAVVGAPPSITAYEQAGTMIDWVGNTRGDLSALNPFVYDTVMAKRSYCEQTPDICKKFVLGIQRAMDFMKSNPDEALKLVIPAYADMAPDLLKEGYFQQVSQLNPTRGKISEAAYKTTQDFAIADGIVTQSQALTHFEGAAYTNAYLQ